MMFYESSSEPACVAFSGIIQNRKEERMNFNTIRYLHCTHELRLAVRITCNTNDGNRDG